MTSSMGFSAKPRVLDSNSFEHDDMFSNEDEDEIFYSKGYLYEVPYTSSSVDRSSIESIPWADDAIKINHAEWEKVEKMLSGVEQLTNTEDDLSKEVLDWRKKFPHILTKNKYKMNNSISESVEMESVPSLDLTSEDEYYLSKKKVRGRTRTRRISSEKDSNNLCQLMDNFTLKSVPSKLNQRETKALNNKRNCASSTSSYSMLSPPTPIQRVPLVITSTNRFRMPPILNVLDSRKKFLSLGQNKNQSFVQLTQIQQAKSAALTQEQKSRTRFQTGHRSAWHVPFAANRFSNNRSSIILPSISTTRQVTQYSAQPITTSTNSEVGTSNTTPSIETRNNFQRINTSSLANNLTSIRHLGLGDSTTNASTQTNTSNSITSGRSISAAVKYPRVTTFNALYLPYSASKFHVFK